LRRLASNSDDAQAQQRQRAGLGYIGFGLHTRGDVGEHKADVVVIEVAALWQVVEGDAGTGSCSWIVRFFDTKAVLKKTCVPQ